MNLTSTDYTRLISWLGYYKYRTIFSKTQIQKLLFVCYGLYNAHHDTLLFTDDTPKAWPFGPVFPITYRRYRDDIPADITEEEKSLYSQNTDALRCVVNVVDKLHTRTATELSEWAHMKGSPWYATIFDKNTGAFLGWNIEIKEDIIKDFFSNDNWKYGLRIQ